MKIPTTIELAVTLDVTSYHPGSPGSFNPRDGGSPPEGAEAEFRVLLGDLDITDKLPDDVIEGLHDVAIEGCEAADYDEP